MSAQNDPRRPTGGDVEPMYYYRRRLTARELLPAVGFAVGASLVVFYLTKLFLERTPLETTGTGSERPRLILHRSSPSGIVRNSGRR